MSGPMSPNDVAAVKLQYLPDAVFDAFNELIARNWRGSSARVDQGEVADLIASKMDIERHDVFWLKYRDVEDAYRAAGWIVLYDKPSYYENHAAHFVFRKEA